jgi:ATP-dependent DNA helicase RecG
MGADDTTCTPIGVTSVKFAKDNLIQASRYCVPPASFVPPAPQVVEIDGKALVVVYVPEATDTIHQSGGVFWIRKGSQTVGLQLAELQELESRRGLRPWDILPAPATLVDLDQQLITRFLAGRSPAVLRHSSLEQTLLGLGAATTTSDRGVVPTQGGLLVFGTHPQSFLPQTEIDAVQWRAPGVPVAGGGRGGWLAHQRIEGSLAEGIERGMNFVRSHLTTEARIVEAHRVETAEYPLEAIREALVNAVLHRDYHLIGQAVRIFLYHDHLQIRSPGRLMSGIILDLLYQGIPLSRPRNPQLMALLRDWPGGAYCERLGSGIRLMVGAMEQAGLPAPVLREEGNEFVVYFFKTAEARAGLPPLPITSGGRAGRTIAEPALAGGADPRLTGLNERQIKGLIFAQQHGRISNEEYRTLMNCSTKMATRDLGDLRNRGFLIQYGSGRALYYVPADQGQHDTDT